MHSQRITATRLQWNFEKGKIHFVNQIADGAAREAVHVARVLAEQLVA